MFKPRAFALCAAALVLGFTTAAYAAPTTLKFATQNTENA